LALAGPIATLASWFFNSGFGSGRAKAVSLSAMSFSLKNQQLRGALFLFNHALQHDRTRSGSIG